MNRTLCSIALFTSIVFTPSNVGSQKPIEILPSIDLSALMMVHYHECENGTMYFTRLPSGEGVAFVLYKEEVDKNPVAYLDLQGRLRIDYNGDGVVDLSIDAAATDISTCDVTEKAVRSRTQ